LDYEESIAYLSSLLRFGIKFGLDRFGEMCRRMGNPERDFRSIHVTGTNGKGSTVTFISAVLQAAGYRTGRYLSPYVRDIRERIQIDGEMIPKEDFAALMTEIRPLFEEIGSTDLGEGTEFEAKTLMAFLYFARRKVDFAVVEVGMGGTYDATNVILPLVSVITNVSLDHTERLGDTVEKIAADKAGIAKRGAPLVTAATGSAWKTIHDICREKGVEIWRVRELDPAVSVTDGESAPPNTEHAVEPDFEVSWKRLGEEFGVCGPAGKLQGLRIGLKGDFQYHNAATAVAALQALQRAGVQVTEEAIRTGLAEARIPGRMEVILEHPAIVLDGAHNPDAAAKLAQSLPRYFKYRKLILVIGMLRTHSAEGVVSRLAPLADIIIATAPKWDKASPAEEIASIARRHCAGLVSTVHAVPDAIAEAISRAAPDDLILVTGSFYTIGEVS